VPDANNGRNVTVTLPDGRRTTFTFSLEPGGSSCLCYHAKWTAPPGVYATLVPTVSDKLITLPGGVLYWQAAGLDTPWEQYDFPGFILTMKDGTQYRIDREALGDFFVLNEFGEDAFVKAYGEGSLTQVTDRNGNRIVINTDSIDHYNADGTLTKQLLFERDGQGRIIALRDPNTVANFGTGGLATISYGYDSLGNLTNVSKLISTNGPIYQSTSYEYTNPQFPHYITAIKDPRGVTPLRTLYDDQGRMIATVDAFGNTNAFIHDIEGRTETVFDRLGNPTVHVYDDRGNVIGTTDALGNTTLRTYSSSNDLLSETDALGHTTTYTYDADGNRLSVTDPLTNTVYFTYDSFGNTLTITNALGRASINQYDSTGNLTRVQDALGHVTSYAYDAAGNRTAETNALGHVTRYDYDQSGNLTNTVDALGHPTVFIYDANGNQLSSTTTRTTPSGVETMVVTHAYDAFNRVVQTIDALGFTNSVSYNEIGRQESTEDALGRETTYEYDAMGQLSVTTYPDGATEQATYDEAGRRVNSMDRAGRITTYVYDAVGRLVQTIYPDGTSTGTGYDAVGRVIASTDARHNATTYGYDAAGRRIAVTNALSQVTTFAYDANGNQKTFTDALERTITYNYDVLDRRTNVVFPDSTTMATFYDDIGQRIAETDQAGITTSFGYDPLGQLVAVTNALNGVTRYFYDEAGNMTNQVDALSRITAFEYDKLGRRTKRTLPLGMSESYAYDAVGNVLMNVDFNGQTTTFSYDSMNRPIQKQPDLVFGQSPIAFAYYHTGLRSNMTDATGTTTYTYDGRDRLLTKETPFGTLTYSYQSSCCNGQLVSIQSSNPNGVSLAYEWDALGRLSTVSDAQLGVVTYGYDAVGNVASYSCPNGVTNIYQYSALNRLTNLTASTVSGVLASYTYRLGASGNRTNVVEHSGRTVVYQYDVLYRLTNEVISADTAGPNGSISYTYDAVGNRLSVASTVAGVTTTTYSYNENDWLSGDQYDANGNTTNSTFGADYYDFENRLTNRNNTVTYLHDGDGNRVGKSENGTNTFFLVDTLNPTGYAQVVEELRSVDGGSTNVVRTYVYAHDRIAQRQLITESWVVSLYGYDGHGSVRFLSDANGTVTNTYTYDAFAILIFSSGATPNNYLYTGEQFDPNIRFYYLRSRYMNPVTARFWTRDSFAGYLFDPATLHKYAYAEMNPVNRRDPTGRESNILTATTASTITSDLDSSSTGTPKTARTVTSNAGITGTFFEDYKVVGYPTKQQLDQLDQAIKSANLLTQNNKPCFKVSINKQAPASSKEVLTSISTCDETWLLAHGSPQQTVFLKGGVRVAADQLTTYAEQSSHKIRIWACFISSPGQPPPSSAISQMIQSLSALQCNQQAGTISICIISGPASTYVPPQ